MSVQVRHACKHNDDDDDDDDDDDVMVASQWMKITSTFH